MHMHTMLVVVLTLVVNINNGVINTFFLMVVTDCVPVRVLCIGNMRSLGHSEHQRVIEHEYQSEEQFLEHRLASCDGKWR